MRNLAESLHRALALPDAPGPDDPTDDTAVAFLSAALRRGPSRLAETFREARLPGDVRLLVLVDQFEEIFRFRDQADADEADAFVELLLAPERAAEGRIYVALTMRSDFLGDCAVFRGLPEAMNDSQFLTPRLTREQRRAAIAGPAGVQGAVIEPALVNRMLNEMGDDPDQLPLMQHCLMRMWTLADGGPLTTEHYEKAGGLERALSKHADDVFQKLTPEQKRIAEVLFKRLSERSEGKRDTRRPVRLKEPAEVAGVAPEKVAEVVEAFRAPGRSLLTPPPPKALDADRVVDISHESLIRQWERLWIWVVEEATSADTYKRLEDTARRWKSGAAGLWGSPDLDIAIQWKQWQKPTWEWSRRYGEHFDIAMEFLEASEEKHRQDEERKKKEFRERTAMLFESQLTHASLLAKVEDYAAARQILHQTRQLDPDTPPERRHARDLMSWYVDLMGGTADKVYEGAGRCCYMSPSALTATSWRLWGSGGRWCCSTRKAGTWSRGWRGTRPTRRSGNRPLFGRPSSIPTAIGSRPQVKTAGSSSGPCPRGKNQTNGKRRPKYFRSPSPRTARSWPAAARTTTSPCGMSKPAKRQTP